jgi:hypothetical protein
VNHDIIDNRKEKLVEALVQRDMFRIGQRSKIFAFFVFSAVKNKSASVGPCRFGNRRSNLSPRQAGSIRHRSRLHFAATRRVAMAQQAILWHQRSSADHLIRPPATFSPSDPPSSDFGATNAEKDFLRSLRSFVAKEIRVHLCPSVVKQLCGPLRSWRPGVEGVCACRR